jgi:hypothetical protein
MKKEEGFFNIPVFGYPRGVFFASSRRLPLVIAAYEDGYAAIELGEEIAWRGWREIRLPEKKAIARVREGRGWRERYFFVRDHLIGEILPDEVVFWEEVPLFEEGGPSWKVAPSWGAPAIRSPSGDRMAGGIGDLFILQPAPGADLDAILYLGSRQDEGWEWHRLCPDGGSLRQRLPVGGWFEMRASLVAVLEEPFYAGLAYVTGWGWNVAHLVAKGTCALGLSPAGDRMVLLRREEEGWVWDFRRIRGTQVLPGPVIPAFSGEALARLGDDPWLWACRISPDLRWAAIAAPGRVLVARIPDPTARQGNPGGQVLDPRRILPVR